jgi:beta-carotene 3-hydroxylase
VSLIVAVCAFVLMEPVTWAAHRVTMHGRRGWRWHASHHRSARSAAPAGRVEANDAFPLVFAALVCGVFALGFNIDALAWLVPAAAGVTAYGAVYALVHDGAIHRRFWTPAWFVRACTPLAAAHELHHRFNGEPYGMLVPIVPARIRARAAGEHAEVPGRLSAG